MGLVGQFLQRLHARLHTTCGWAWYRLGCRLRARRHFEQVLLLRGDDFGAYVHLGLIAFALGDYAGWRREFEHARRTDPDRFAKLRQPFELFEPRLAGTDFDEARERATWRSLRPFGPGLKHRSSTQRPEGPTEHGLDALLPGCDARADTSAAEPASAEGAALPPAHGDDFCSLAERKRFRELAPIRTRDVGACDLDDLARRLLG